MLGDLQTGARPAGAQPLRPLSEHGAMRNAVVNCQRVRQAYRRCASTNARGTCDKQAPATRHACAHSIVIACAELQCLQQCLAGSIIVASHNAPWTYAGGVMQSSMECKLGRRQLQWAQMGALRACSPNVQVAGAGVSKNLRRQHCLT